MQRTSVYPPFSNPGPSGIPRGADAELPSIDAYLDELPPIEEFAFDAGERGPERESIDEADWAGEQPAVPEVESDSDGWALDPWQSFDWGSVQDLGPGATKVTVASPASSMSEAETATADEVAAALDAVAQRIRSGQLSIGNLQGTNPEAAIAAALAVFLRTRG